MYQYKVLEVLRVVDGDTIDAKITLGFGLDANFRFRLRSVDVAEVYGKNASAEGEAAKQFVESWFETHRDDLITVHTYPSSDATVGIGDGAFGRWLGDFYATSKDGVTTSDLTIELMFEGTEKGWIKD